MNEVHYSSEDTTWETPPEVFNPLNERFKFTLDPCCSPDTAKCEKFYTEQEDGLTQNWEGQTVFVNPPYGREIGKWVKKCAEEGAKPNTVVVMLIPARTDTKYFHEHIYHKAEIRFMKGRVKFLRGGQRIKSAPFPTMLVIFSQYRFINH